MKSRNTKTRVVVKKKAKSLKTQSFYSVPKASMLASEAMSPTQANLKGEKLETIFLRVPRWLRRQLKQECAELDCSLNALGIEKLSVKVKDLPKKRKKK